MTIKIKILILLLMTSVLLPKRLPHQKSFMLSKARGKALVTGYGGGKTYIHAHELIKHSILDRGLPHMGVSPSYKMAKKTLIPAIIEVLQDHYNLVSGKDFKFNKSDHEFKINTWDGVIWIGSGDSPDSLNGPNLASFGIDEPGQQKEDVKIKMLARLRHPKANYLQYWYTGTPEGLNWFFDVCEGDKRPKDFELIRGKTTDNTHLPTSFIDDLYDQYDSVLVDAYINGLFVNMASGPAYHAFSHENILKDEYIPNPNRPIMIGQDFNYNPMCSILSQEVMINGKICVIVFDEFFLKNADTDAAFERIIDKYGNKYYYEVYPDPACYSRTGHGAAKTDIRLIKNAFEKYGISWGDGYRVAGETKHPRRKDRLNSVNKMLCNSRGERKLYFANGVKYILEDMRKNTMDEFLNGNFEDKMRGHMGDALGYKIHKKYPVRIERPYQQQLIA